MTETSASGTGTEKSATAKSRVSTGDEGKDTQAKESQAASAAKFETTGTGSRPSIKKPRKVNHGKVPFTQDACNTDLGTIFGPGMCLLSSLAYDLRSGTTSLPRLSPFPFPVPRGTSCQRRCKPEDVPADQFQFVKGRPCTRCIKRDIGHLCHDELREPTRQTQSKQDHSAADKEGSSNNELANVQGMPRTVDVPDAAGQKILPDGTIGISPSSARPGDIPPSGRGLDSNSQWLMAYNDWLGSQNQFQDMHWFHQSYMFNAPKVTNEYNLLGDFLSNSLLNNRAMFQNQDIPGIYSDPSLMNSIVGNNKAHETYYMTAADPSGSDPPEERMNKLLKAKYDAGLLKPFNYVKGYARLNEYIEKNMQNASRQRILRQFDKFRPKFRELMYSLTDVELILVEIWFEQSLMEYDRVFASMAIPACCWRRTGEIFRGNNEMAQLIDVPIESSRDAKLAIHEIITEDQLVSYWETFGAIAFDNSRKAILTSCTLKSPTHEEGGAIPCCFSFTIRRENHDIPSLIVGNFLPT
ncbi:uncharacterized protein N7482_001567 [Penicillium canariense]|uniref:ERT1/acuK family PAS domain-containing protein n=1 Tax=Penicillium canariense TaxID=189055 RepID=A0A9W9IGX0_9EURO|nr:uncharacterized protein N7482_001567 [Penicillium canariense]KAJ5175690.1 hypothetical protein N7482_001567 [Penicillium canariense]